MPRLLILNYHRITVPGDAIDPRFRTFTLDRADFGQQLELIRRLEIPVVSLAADPNTWPEAPLVVGLTFDDGHDSDLRIAAPLLQQFDFTATFFPVVRHIGQEGCLDWDDLDTLLHYGFSVGSHSWSHASLPRLDRKRLEQEIHDSKRVLESRLGVPVRLFALPYGHDSAATRKTIASAGYAHMLSTEFGFNKARDTGTWKRWNIRRTTSLTALGQVLRQQQLPLLRRRGLSRLRQTIIFLSRRFLFK